jgi:hypothetical protein
MRPLSPGSSSGVITPGPGGALLMMAAVEIPQIPVTGDQLFDRQLPPGPGQNCPGYAQGRKPGNL